MPSAVPAAMATAIRADGETRPMGAVPAESWVPNAVTLSGYAISRDERSHVVLAAAGHRETDDRPQLVVRRRRRREDLPDPHLVDHAGGTFGAPQPTVVAGERQS